MLCGVVRFCAMGERQSKHNFEHSDLYKKNLGSSDSLAGRSFFVKEAS